MPTNPWMPFYVSDYLADTMRFSTVEHGAYILLIIDYWRNGAPPPDDEKTLLSITKLRGRDSKRCLKTVLDKFTLVDGHWTHKRIDEELEKANHRLESARSNGKLGGNPAFKKGKPNPYKHNRKVIPPDNRPDNPPGIPADKLLTTTLITTQDHHTEIHTQGGVGGKSPSPIVDGCVYFRMSDSEKTNVQNQYKLKGLPLELLPDVIAEVDRWLQTDSPKPTKARASKSHALRCYDAWAIDNALKARQNGKKASSIVNGPTNIGETLKDKFGFLPSADERARLLDQEARRRFLEAPETITFAEKK